MTARIKYETPGGTETIRRDEYHTKDALLIAFNQATGGVDSKVSIPLTRVVRIDDE